MLAYSFADDLYNFFRNFAMNLKHWLGTNPGGSKVDFEAFFKSFEAGQKKVRCPNSVCVCSAKKKL
jgi:hypothetical protein